MSANIINTIRTKTIAVGAASFLVLGGALSVGATNPAAAAPLGANAIALSEAAPGQVIQVGKKRWKKWRRHGHRHHHHHHGWGKRAIAGLALGIIGASIASHHYPHWGYHRHHRYCGHW
jgi:hypothetical protein